jgi:hypothetical protein
LIPLGLALLIAGAVVVALPDDDERLFSFSETHGPSRLDAVGIVLLLAGWGVLLGVLWRGRDRLLRRGWLIVGGLVFAIGAGVLAGAIATDAGWWWLLGAALMASVQAVAVAAAARG